MASAMPAWLKRCVKARVRGGAKVKRARKACLRHNDPAQFGGYSRYNRRSRRVRRGSKRSR